VAAATERQQQSGASMMLMLWTSPGRQWLCMASALCCWSAGAAAAHTPAAGGGLRHRRACCMRVAAATCWPWTAASWCVCAVWMLPNAWGWLQDSRLPNCYKLTPAACHTISHVVPIASGQFGSRVQRTQPARCFADQPGHCPAALSSFSRALSLSDHPNRLPSLPVSLFCGSIAHGCAVLASSVRTSGLQLTSPEEYF
jgi:hypothetical protein